MLITGGTGYIGGQVARWLASRGATHLVLAGRRGEQAPGAGEVRAELEAAGARVTLAACDAADRDALAALLEATAPQAVFHAAGTDTPTPLETATPEELARVLAAKAEGARHLHELCADRPLTAFVLFSSVAGVWGGGGQAAYAAANAYLDALAEHRRAAGLPATSLAWGPWAGGGMAARPEAAAHLARRGLRPLPPRAALAALADALGREETAVAVADVAWERFAPAFTATRPSPLLDGLPRAREALAGPGGPNAPGADGRSGDPAGSEAAARLRAALAEAEPEERTRALATLVRAEAAAALGHPGPERVDPALPFRDLGFDSLTAVELRDRLAAATGVRLPTTLVFDHPTARDLAAHLDGLLPGRAEQAATPPAPAASGGPAEPIAIVAMGCRYPGGADSPEALWRLVAEGRDAVGGFPADRGWDLDGLYHPDPEHPGTSYARTGGFLHDLPAFDAAFFGISPREALAMDPQQRLLLEIAWEAFERAGLPPSAVRGSRSGVFVGTGYQDYGSRLAHAPADLHGYLGTGNSASVISGRLSYTLGLQGPAVTVDTACSSSLVALHLAVQALRGGECDLALAGGVTAMSTPATFIETSRQRAISPDGRCKAFAAAADGTGWAEGAGILLLERLSDARRNGHPVLAVVRGSAVNQDGASNGLTAPNGPAQERVIRAALANARLTPADIDAVEAHGTGTTLGDPIEAHALLATYGAERPGPGRPLLLGSLKSNIGHAQAAAGVGGVIKMVQALRHGLLPRTLHVDRPSPHVDWESGAVRLLTEPVRWEADGERPRRAGISAFGISGTNAHAIVEEAPAAPAGAGEDQEPDEAADGEAPARRLDPVAVPLPLSARSAPALAEQAARLAAFLAPATDGPGSTAAPARAVEPAALAHALAATRGVFEHRAVVVGRDRGELADRLKALAAGEQPARTARGVVPAGAAERRPVFVFPGQGSEWPGMALGLLDASPAFRERMDACAEALRPLGVPRPQDVLRGAPGAPALEHTDVIQPVLWAVMVSLAGLWTEAGVAPAAVLGHSQGEIAAACVAGALSLEDAALVVVARSALMRSLALSPADGAMAALSVSAEEAAGRLAPHAGRISLAAVNGPRSVVVSGDAEALAELADRARAEGVRVKTITGVGAASHSHHVEPLRERLLADLAGLAPRAPLVPFRSTVTGECASGPLGAEYWWRNLRDTVRLEPAVRALLGTGHTAFVEISPHPVLALSIQETAGATRGADRPNAVESDGGSEPVVVVPTLRRGEGGPERFLASLGEAHAGGVPVDWAALFAGWPAAPALPPLPTYPFQRRRFWLEAQPPAPGGARNSRDGERGGEDGEFWGDVERGDLAALAARLGLPQDATLATALPALAAWRKEREDEAAAATWHHRVAWRPLPAGPAPVLTGRWAVAHPEGASGGPVLRAVLAALAAHGAEPLPLPVAPGEDRDALAARLRAAGEAPAGLIALPAPDERPLPGPAAALALLQAAGDAGWAAPLWCLTRGAVSTGPQDAVTRPAQGELWGLGRAAALELPGRWGGLVDLPEVVDEEAGRRLVAVLASGTGEDQVAVRAEGTFARRIVPDGDSARGADAGWSPPETVLITGGTGYIGGQVARWLASQGARHLVLAGRRGEAAPGAGELRAELEAAGARVTFAACDAADRGALAALLEATEPQAVFHAAGAGGAPALLERLTPAALAEELAAKAEGARHLHELCQGRPLTAFVLFSSGASAWGSGGQGAYAAANAYLDALAEHRAAAGLPATSVAWGPWAGGGMVDEAGAARAARLGLGLMPPARALAALRRVLTGGRVTAVVAPIDWERFAPAFTATRPSPLLTGVPAAVRALRAPASPGTPDGAREPGEPGPARRLAALPPAERAPYLAEFVCAQTAAVLGHDTPEAVGPHDNFLELGFDSLTALELRKRLGAATGRDLPGSLAFDHPTPARLAAHLHALLDPPTAAPAASGDGGPGEESLAALYLRANERGRLGAALDLARNASLLRDTFADPAEGAALIAPLRLARGPARPQLICVAGYMAPSGVHPYARFAAAFGGRREVWALPLPGFAPGQPLPESVAALAAAEAEALRRALGADQPVVLAGYSAGGWVAQAVAAALLDLGRPVRGVVMIDSFSRRVPLEGRFAAATVRGQLDRIEVTPGLSAHISAMGGYLRAFDGYDPPGAVPTLALRAADWRGDASPGADGAVGSEGSEGDDRPPPPELAGSVVTVPGDHYTLMEDHAPAAAAAVEAWLTGPGPQGRSTTR
ncbi:SDR family NAD(P)-dependent oxidoreductase [Streptomyces sp. DSM 44917]|uniref:SDR family NAD(P)-dependent oxidoreductase n=1 Tax=Streptomyces boetiae TaxID=3075541 RepID=A0ABU2LDM6_9ACTN|nr:SDR family NAD(P)-dependent oxidoreductase [Streptomyces sp. DSM 44917]MDT0309689.1 SDR family NAD(P)-dependent oxidoreductase [Streptomyces sp. DSM 44917]